MALASVGHEGTRTSFECYSEHRRALPHVLGLHQHLHVGVLHICGQMEQVEG